MPIDMRIPRVELANPHSVADTLRTHGVAVVPNYLDVDAAQATLQELDVVMTAEKPGNWSVNRSPFQTMVICEPEFVFPETGAGFGVHPFLSAFPEMASFLSDRRLRTITRLYFQDQPSVHGGRIQFVHSIDTPKDHALARDIPYVLHHDRVRMLKFYLCLHCVEPDGGPLQILLDPHALETSEQRRASFKTEGKFWREIDGQVDPGTREVVDLCGEAGDLILFDSNQPHRQGFIAAGRERRIVIVEAESLAERGYRLKGARAGY